ncbi:MAG: PKD domain-containing protein [Ferruginibacter sp.]
MKLQCICLAVVIPAFIFMGCSKNATAPVPAPVASFTSFSFNLAPTEVVFTSTSKNVVSYSWDFGDLTTSSDTSTDANPSYIYNLPGTYTVRLTVKGVDGSSVSAQKKVTIDAPPYVRIGAAKVTNMPFLDPSCNCGWDPTSGPDVYFRFSDNANNILATGITYTDASAAGLPFLWNYGGSYLPSLGDYQITDFNKIYKVSIYDADAPPADPDDLIGEFSFNFASYPTATGYPQTITLTAPFPNTLTIVLTLYWGR